MENVSILNEDLGIIKVSELTKEDVKQLPCLPVRIVKKESKKTNQVYIELEVQIHERLKVSPKLSNDRMTLVEYNFFKELYKSDLRIEDETKELPVRFFKGVNKNGKEYYRIQVIFGKYLYKNIWLDKTDIAYIQHLEKKQAIKPIHWFERQDENFDGVAELDALDQFE